MEIDSNDIRDPPLRGKAIKGVDATSGSTVSSTGVVLRPAFEGEMKEQEEEKEGGFDAGVGVRGGGNEGRKGRGSTAVVVEDVAALDKVGRECSVLCVCSAFSWREL